jgi:hypothetical protein
MRLLERHDYFAPPAPPPLHPPPPPPSAAANKEGGGGGGADADLGAAAEVLTPEQAKILRESVLGAMARSGAGGIGSGGNGGNDDDDAPISSLSVVMGAAGALDTLVAQKCDEVSSMDLQGYARVCREFNTRCALAIWRHERRREHDEHEAFISSGGGGGAGGGGTGGGGASAGLGGGGLVPSRRNPDAELDAELGPLVGDALATLSAIVRYQPSIGREVCTLDLDTGLPLPLGDVTPEALEREDARLARAARAAGYSRAQLCMLSDVYTQYLPAARGAADRLRAAARELAAVVDAGAAPPSPPPPRPCCPTELASPTDEIEAALAEEQLAGNVTGLSYFQITSPSQYAKTAAAMHPRVLCSWTVLRGAWLLRQQELAEEQQQKQQQQRQLQQAQAQAQVGATVAPLGAAAPPAAAGSVAPMVVGSGSGSGSGGGGTGAGGGSATAAAAAAAAAPAAAATGPSAAASMAKPRRSPT